jgi:hypothetical protein
VILQEFVAGDLYSACGFVSDFVLGEVSVVREFCVNSDWRVDVSYQVRKSPVLQSRARAALETISSGVWLESGYVHMQFLWDGGEIKVLEVFHRMPGDLYGVLLELGGVSNFYRQYLESYLPGSVKVEAGAVASPGHVLRVTLPDSTRNRVDAMSQIATDNSLTVLFSASNDRMRFSPNQKETSRRVIFIENPAPWSPNASVFGQICELVRAVAA